MHFRDLRDHSNDVSVCEASAVLVGRIMVERVYCLDASETWQYLKNRIEEESKFRVRSIKLEHKDRYTDASIWEARIELGGKVETEKPATKEEIQKIIHDLAKRVGFGKTNVEVKEVGASTQQASLAGMEMDDQEVVLAAQKAMGVKTEKKKAAPNRAALLKLHKGDKIKVARAGFEESAEVLSIDKTDDTIYARVESAGSPQYISFHKIVEIPEALTEARMVEEAESLIKEIAGVLRQVELQFGNLYWDGVVACEWAMANLAPTTGAHVPKQPSYKSPDISGYTLKALADDTGRIMKNLVSDYEKNIIDPAKSAKRTAEGLIDRMEKLHRQHKEIVLPSSRDIAPLVSEYYGNIKPQFNAMLFGYIGGIAKRLNLILEKLGLIYRIPRKGGGGERRHGDVQKTAAESAQQLDVFIDGLDKIITTGTKPVDTMKEAMELVILLSSELPEAPPAIAEAKKGKLKPLKLPWED